MKSVILNHIFQPSAFENENFDKFEEFIKFEIAK